jgi:uncharacterized SAM-binding protein YcdF (DUF218 family)
MNELEIDILAKKIWDYHHMNQKLEKADAILVLGSYDLRIAAYAAKLFLDGYAPLIIFSGKEGIVASTGQLTSQLWGGKSEAEAFADVAMKAGVPKEKILIENQSTNTSENIQFTQKLLEEKGLNMQKFILVQKPYMERRSYATFKQRWPEKDAVVTSPPISYEEYPYELKPREAVINSVVGDLQRIKVYGEKGYSLPQDIPADVWDAYEKLVAMGYDKNLVK